MPKVLADKRKKTARIMRIKAVYVLGGKYIWGAWYKARNAIFTLKAVLAPFKKFVEISSAL